MSVRREPIVLPTYEPAQPDKNPMFLEKRVYQGSSGKVYPLPFTDRIAEEPTDRTWNAITLENGFVEVMLLPEIGGRIHAARDLTNGYDFIYRNSVIKPALVGLAGSWISGGIEFNWPQHHRPSTFMPSDVSIEHGEDGSITVWMSEHEPLNRMKGMHGVCLHPDRSVIEIKVRLYNRTPYVQTFLWWANMAAKVHEGYKSFFPPDVHAVADHAKRAVSAYPLCEDRYYGVDYGTRGAKGVPEDEKPSQYVPANCGGASPDYPPNDLSWYANIPVPTSYMCLGTKEDFFGGYDFFAKAGLIHLADRHIAPGKKQWTWGNHEFGYAWDRNLTDYDGPYIELMAGVYTDNQPDFSFLMPGETKTFSQFLYPYQSIGPADHANLDVAISLGQRQVGVAATRRIEAEIIVTLASGDRRFQVEISPNRPFIEVAEAPQKVVVIENGVVIGWYEHTVAEPTPISSATEPPLPEEIDSTDELFTVGQHLEQYRHATRNSADYWREALRRDPGDTRSNNALGLWHFRRGEFELAETYFHRAIDRMTSRNPNPYDGEPLYNLGLVLRFMDRDSEAVDAFAKAAWNYAWQAPAWHALGELACKRRDWKSAVQYLEQAIRRDPDNFRARNLHSIVMRRLGRQTSLQDVLSHDPLDHWARYLDGQDLEIDNNTRLDLVIDHMRAGLYEEALALLGGANSSAEDGSVPMVGYYRAWLEHQCGMDPSTSYSQARSSSPDYCFPARLEDIPVLKAAPTDDARAAFYLGNLMYDRRRYDEAIRYWERAVSLEPGNAIALRNLGIAAHNVLGDTERAKAAYDEAISANPDDARHWYERDQLWKRTGVSPESRLDELRKRRDLVDKRDDLTIEFCTLLNAVGEFDKALEILEERRFQPWEGGEGMALGIYTRTHLALGHRALAAGEVSTAKSHFEKALRPPYSLGEARHLLANASDLWLAIGDALAASGDHAVAQQWWKRAADFKGDFQEMSVRPFSEYTYFQAIAMERLGRVEEAHRLLMDLRTYALELAETEAKIDYFATSLPTMLLFEDDLQARRENTARFLLAQAAAGLDEKEEALRLIAEVLEKDPNHALASDLRASL